MDLPCIPLVLLATVAVSPLQPLLLSVDDLEFCPICGHDYIGLHTMLEGKLAKNCSFQIRTDPLVHCGCTAAADGGVTWLLVIESLVEILEELEETLV